MVFDISRTLRSYEYTKRSVADLNRVISSQQFEEMASDTIFDFLQNQMEIVSFKDYLKRYIYEKTKPYETFSQVPEAYYVSVICDSFAMNRAPHAFTPVKTRWTNIVKRWLNSDSVKRSTVFLLGFGLKMTDQEVSAFLTKVLKEQDFRFDDPSETVFWHCFHNGLPYSSAVELLEECKARSSSAKTRKTPQTDPGEPFWENVGDSLTLYLSNKAKIREYLSYLDSKERKPRDLLFEEFYKLYERAVMAARMVVQEEKDNYEDTSGIIE